MDDLCVYSGHIRGFRGIKKQEYADERDVNAALADKLDELINTLSA